MTRELTIQGFDTRLGARGLYVRYTDRTGRDHHKPLETALEYCDKGFYGLSKADKDAFRVAHDRWIVEMELGIPLPFKGPIRCPEERVL